MTIQGRFIKENDAYFFVKSNIKKPIPTPYFKIFFDAIIGNLATNNCLTEIKPEIINFCKRKVGNEFNSLVEAVDLIFYLTLQLRRDLTDELSLRDDDDENEDACTFDEFEGMYRLRLMQHQLPFPDHEIFNTKKVLKSLGEPDFAEESEIEDVVESANIAHVNEWKQKNPEIASSAVLYKQQKDTPENLILQQIIQHYIKEEIQYHGRVTVRLVFKETMENIKTSEFLNKIPNIDIQIRKRIAETKKIMLTPQTGNSGVETGTAGNQVLGKRNSDTAQATTNEQMKKRGHLEPIDVNNDERAQANTTVLVALPAPTLAETPAPFNQNQQITNQNIVPPNSAKPERKQFLEIKPFLDKNFRLLKEKGMSDGRLHLFNKYKQEGGQRCDMYFSKALREKITQVVDTEIETSYPHLKNIKPVIERLGHKELDLFLQKMIQWELAQKPSASFDSLVPKIMTAMKNSSLPYESVFSEKAIQTRIRETREYNIAQSYRNEEKR